MDKTDQSCPYATDDSEGISTSDIFLHDTTQTWKFANANPDAVPSHKPILASFSFK